MKIASPKWSALLLGILLSSSAALHAQTQLFDYNTPEQWNELYRTGPGNAITTTYLWSRAESGGISDTPWASISQANNGIPGFQVVEQTFSTARQTFTLGVNFHWKSMNEAPAVGGNTGLILGIGKAASPEIQYIPRYNSNDTADPLTDATAEQIHIGFGLTSTANEIRVLGGGATNGARVFFGNNAGAETAILTPDSWYYMEVTFAPGVINTTFDVTVGIYESSATGVRGNSILSQTYNRTNVALLDADVHAFLGGVSHRYSNIAGVDNFSAPIPEPGSAALVVGGLTLAGLYRFRSASH